MKKAFYKVVDSAFQTLFPSWIEKLKKELDGYTTVLDLGCGYKSPIQYCNVPFSIGVDLHDPYLKAAKEKGIHTQYIKADISWLELAPRSFDVVIAIGVLEHMTKEQAYKLITRMQTWAKKKVVIMTPNGYVFQDMIDDNPLQKHQCGWTTKELRNLGFEVYGEHGWKRLRGYRALVKYRPRFLWGVVSGITQYVAYFYPQLAFDLFAVKELNPGVESEQ